MDVLRDANAPYDLARARAALGRALLQEGQTVRAHGELHGARAAFDSLGAGLDLARLTKVEPGA